MFLTLNANQLAPLVSIIFGVLILAFPKLLNYLVALQLILVGLLGLGFIR